MNDFFPFGIGLCIESLQISAQTAAPNDDGCTITPIATPICDVPPAVLMPQLTGEPLRFDSTFPLHPRGVADVWPPEVTADAEIGKGPRFPIALAWTGLNLTAPLRWRVATPFGESYEATPAEAIAAAVAAIPMKESETRPAIVLVVPNQLRMERQQELIDACRRQERNVKLLWRPIAAALAWCDEFGEGFLDSHGNITGPVGRLLCLHLGLDGFEIAAIELVVEMRNGRRWLLPARCRPDPGLGALPSFGLQSIVRGVSSPSLPSLWLTSAIENALQSLDDGGTGTLSESFDRSIGQNDRCKKALNAWVSTTTSPADIQRWFTATINRTSDLVGGVVTGELARCRLDERTSFNRLVVDALPTVAARSRLLLETRADRVPSILARGAAIHAMRLARDEPSYLDTLPRIRTATYIDGKLTWLDLLKSDDGYVDGGRIWRRPQPLNGLKVQAGRHRIEITIWHDEFPTVRKVGAEFAQAVAEDVPVGLDVRIDPAQGNARVDVVPTLMNAGVRRLQLEWRHMLDEKLSPEAWLLRQPTLFPTTLRRACSRTRWISVRSAMESYLRHPTSHGLNAVIDGLKQTEQTPESQRDLNVEARATAISSDGDPPGGTSQTLELFVARALSLLRTATGDTKNDLIRSLGYTSTGHPEFQSYLGDRIVAAGFQISDHELAACGRCLRFPATIASFARALLAWLRTKPKKINVWLKAFGEILRCREDATRYLPSETCEKLTSSVLAIFEIERRDGTAQFLFRNSALCIVYLLRRRAYDDNYLRPGERLHAKVREAFQLAITDAKDGRLKVIGGTIKLDRVLQTMIDYIDRKGSPGLTWDAGLQSLTE